MYWLEIFKNTFQNGVFLQYFLLLAVWDNFFHWNIYVHIKVRYILFWFFVILFWKTFNCPCCVAEWNDKPIETHKKFNNKIILQMHTIKFYLFEFKLEFKGIIWMELGKFNSSKPRGIVFIFLDPRGMINYYSLTPQFLEEWNLPRNCHP